MAQFAQFVAVGGTDDAFRLPDSTSNRTTRTFDLPDLDPERKSVLMFKVAMSGNISLTMQINDNPGLSINFSLESRSDLDALRSWHEVLDAHAVRESKNILIIKGEGGGVGAAVSVSDIVVLYHANTD
ncbi:MULTISPECIES: hypothetical protein [Streptomyces]|uniref:hypothetical protein n=1 Tax=Streptomyces TaxID=1883 RepID=UPI0012602966|nr:MULTISPECIES: hypothetical protein [Streptomyces]QMV07101.1 hypothetical protein GJU35_16405 [Streptomyces lincolnensis]